jgi:signal transduction histidine kinase
MIDIANIDLFSVGIVVAASFILSIAVFINDRRSATNIAFLLFALVTIGYSIVNYLSYQTNDPTFKLWTIRSVLFFASFHAGLFFALMRTFPNANATMSRRLRWILGIFTTCVACLTLSPYVFSGVITNPGSSIAQPVPAPGILIFGLFVLFCIIAGITSLVKKIMVAPTHIEKVQFRYLLIGVVAMFTLIIVFNFLFPVFLQDSRFIALAPVFIFIFIACTAYAIFKHHLLSVKVITTEILAFLLTVATFSEIIFSQTLVEVLFRVGEFTLVLIFSLLLIKSVLKEVEQREELERLNKQIAEKNAQLEDLSRFKSELLSLASHQIKSPLAAIKGFASLIADGSYGEVGAPVKETIGKIQHSADDLIGLINTLLDVRKVEEGKMEYKFERVDLAEMIAKMIDLLQPLASAKQLQLSFDFQRKPVWVNADPEKLKQVIQNLTDNAIKYTPSGFVKISLKEDAGAVTVSVSDSGLGVPTDLIPHLFEEFVRDERVKKEIRGTGLGLYIARKIAEAHGGKVWAESAGIGKGSTFNVSIPEIK